MEDKKQEILDSIVLTETSAQSPAPNASSLTFSIYDSCPAIERLMVEQECQSKLAQRNLFAKNSNLSVVLSFVQQVSLFLPLRTFFRSPSRDLLLVPVIVDIFLTVVAIGVMRKYPRIVIDWPNVSVREAQRYHLLGILCKLGLGAIMYYETGDGKAPNATFGFIVVLLLSAVLLCGTIFAPLRCFNSTFSLINTLTMLLFTLRYFDIARLDLLVVFILCYVYGWVLTVITVSMIFVTFCLIWRSLFRCSLFEVFQSLAGFAYALSVSAQGMVYIGLADFVRGRLAPPYPIDLFTFSSFYLMVAAVNFALGIAFSFSKVEDRPVMVGSSLSSDSQNSSTAKSKPPSGGVITMLTLLQLNPNHIGMGVAPGSEVQVERRFATEESINCFASDNQCDILPCNHTGLCLACAKNLLLNMNSCPICHQHIDRIAKIQKVGNGDYRVLNEAISDN